MFIMLTFSYALDQIHENLVNGRYGCVLGRTMYFAKILKNTSSE